MLAEAVCAAEEVSADTGIPENAMDAARKSAAALVKIFFIKDILFSVIRVIL